MKKKRKKTDCSSKAAFIDLQKPSSTLRSFTTFPKGVFSLSDIHMEHVATTLVVSWRGVAKARQKRVHRLPKERFTLANVERVPSKSITTKVFYFPSPYPNSKAITSTHRLVIQPSKHYLEMVIFQPVLT